MHFPVKICDKSLLTHEATRTFPRRCPEVPDKILNIMRASTKAAQLIQFRSQNKCCASASLLRYIALYSWGFLQTKWYCCSNMQLSRYSFYLAPTTSSGFSREWRAASGWEEHAAAPPMPAKPNRNNPVYKDKYAGFILTVLIKKRTAIFKYPAACQRQLIWHSMVLWCWAEDSFNFTSVTLIVNIIY